MKNTSLESQRRRVAGSDLSTAEAVFKAAMVLIVPEDQTQRKAFESLMPYMYVLRNKGCSWDQITKLLTECGFKLQPSTVRSYYGEMLAARLDVCQERMNEQMLLMAEVRKETSGTDVSGIVGKVEALMARQRNTAADKINTVFGIDSEPSIPTRHQARAEQPEAPPGKTVDRSSRPVKPAQQKPRPVPIDEDEAPPVPVIDPSARKSAAPGKKPNNQPKAQANEAPVAYQCAPLQAGIKPLKPRDGIAKEVYEPGDLDHPAIPGLTLTLEQRLYGAALELIDSDTGEIRLESGDEKRYRVGWKKPIPMTRTATASSFTRMDQSIFKQPN